MKIFPALHPWNTCSQQRQNCQLRNGLMLAMMLGARMGIQHGCSPKSKITENVMSEVWKVENKGPTSNAVAMEALTSGYASAPNQYVCTNTRTREVKTVIADDTWHALEIIRKEETLQAR